MTQDLTQQEWEKLVASSSNPVILDVRTDEEVADGYIPGMKHIDIREGNVFMEKLEALDKTKTYFVYCRSGARSQQACEIMDQMGFQTCYNLLDGFMQWGGAVEH